MYNVRPCVLWVTLVYVCLLLPGLAAVDADNRLLQSCAANILERRLYVSTVDGGLTALSTSGEQLWRYEYSQPLFKSTLSYGEASEAVPNLIPGLNHALYHWDGLRLQSLPFTADDLIDSSQLAAGRGSALVGSKTRDVIGINAQTGKPLYECTPERCHRYDNNSLIQKIDVLKLGVARVTVREASELTGEEMWNFTVGNIQLSLVEGVEDEFSCHTSANLPWELQVDTGCGLLHAVDRSLGAHESEAWQVKLSAPIVDVWLHDGGRLERVQLVSQSPHIPNSPSLMLVHYNNQFYIQPVVKAPVNQALSVSGDLESQEAPTCKPSNADLIREHMEHYYFLSSVATEHSLDYDNDPESPVKELALYDNGFIHMQIPGPNGLAVYFSLDFEECYRDSGSGEDNESVDACVPTAPLGITNISEQGSLLSSIWSYAKSVVKYFLFGMFVAVLSHIRHANRYQRLVSESRIDVDTAFSVSISPATSTETLTSSEQSMESLAEPRTIARFDSDYELKGQLGKGGFGVVYHVQNKLDGGEYAIKRIKLPTNKSAKDKVMREVHALARLDHPRIVRYFHSWVEKAPAGWTEMEEWMPLSRKASYGGETPSQATADIQTNTSVFKPSKEGGRIINLSHINNNSSLLGSNLSPCPSFNSLSHSAIHSVLPPIVTADSRSSSFVIEFQEDGHGEPQLSSRPHQEGCFARDLLNRDELSSGSSCSASTEDRERQDSITDLIVEPPTYLFIQMQLCQKESLKDWLSKNVLNRKKETVMYFFEQTLEAVLYVHNKGMMHRDLKPSNIFFSLDGQVKVGDFGLVTGSAFANFGSSYLALKSLGDDHKQHTGNIGTHYYISPEQLSGIKYNNKVDIFSLGVIFFELIYPFTTQMERVKELDNLRSLQFPPRFKTHLPLEAEIVEWLMASSASKRPSAQELAESAKLRLLKESYVCAEVQVVPKL